MGELTPVFEELDTFDVTMTLTENAVRQLEAMPPRMQELAEVAIHSFLGRICDYFACEADEVSYIGRTKEDLFGIGFEIFGPTKVYVHDIRIEFEPIDECTGYFRLNRNRKLRLFPVSSSDVARSELSFDLDAKVIAPIFTIEDISIYYNSLNTMEKFFRDNLYSNDVAINYIIYSDYRSSDISVRSAILFEYDLPIFDTSTVNEHLSATNGAPVELSVDASFAAALLTPATLSKNAIAVTVVRVD